MIRTTKIVFVIRYLLHIFRDSCNSASNEVTIWAPAKSSKLLPTPWHTGTFIRTCHFLRKSSFLRDGIATKRMSALLYILKPAAAQTEKNIRYCIPPLPGRSDFYVHSQQPFVSLPECHRKNIHSRLYWDSHRENVFRVQKS